MAIANIIFLLSPWICCSIEDFVQVHSEACRNGICFSISFMFLFWRPAHDFFIFFHIYIYTYSVHIMFNLKNPPTTPWGVFRPWKFSFFRVPNPLGWRVPRDRIDWIDLLSPSQKDWLLLSVLPPCKKTVLCWGFLKPQPGKFVAAACATWVR